MSDAVVELRQVTKSYGRKQALRGLNLTLTAGQIVGFIGPNGAGKSTCMRLLVGLTFRDGGSVSVLGKDPATEGVEVRRRLCYLPGETSLYAQLTGAEVLKFAYAGYERQDRALSDEMREAFELPLQRKVRQYSAGMKQKLALLATLVPDVDLYLLDEPERNLDPSTQLFMRDVVARLGQAGKTVLFSSHRLGEVEALSQRLIFLLDGELIDEERVRSAREALRREVRLRMAPGAILPEGAEQVATEPDGTVCVRTDDDPLLWIARLDPARVLSVEIGTTNLEPLYRRLSGGS